MSEPRAKPTHMAKLIRPDGAVSPLCAEKPRAINLKRATWTNRKEAVTCLVCRRIIENIDTTADIPTPPGTAP